MWPDNANWQMTLLFLLALASLGFVMKLVALLLPSTVQVSRRGISGGLVSPNSVLPSQPATIVASVVLRILVLLVSLLLSYWVYRQLVREFQVRGIFLSYLAVPYLYLMMEFLVAVETLFFLPGG